MSDVVIMRKTGREDRVARTATERVQLEHDGYRAVRDASPRVADVAAGAEAAAAAKAAKEAAAKAKAKQDSTTPAGD